MLLASWKLILMNRYNRTGGLHTTLSAFAHADPIVSLAGATEVLYRHEDDMNRSMAAAGIT